MLNDTMKFAAVVLVGGVIGSQYLARKLDAPAPAQRPAPARAQTATPAYLAQTELTADAAGHYHAQVEIDHRTIEMLVDTGATIIALTNEDADRLSIRPAASAYTMQMSTANGIARAASVHLQSVRVGNVEVRDVEAVVMAPRALGVSLLGNSFLAKLSGYEQASGRLVLKQ